MARGARQPLGPPAAPLAHAVKPISRSATDAGRPLPNFASSPHGPHWVAMSPEPCPPTPHGRGALSSLQTSRHRHNPNPALGPLLDRPGPMEGTQALPVPVRTALRLVAAPLVHDRHGLFASADVQVRLDGEPAARTSGSSLRAQLSTSCGSLSRSHRPRSAGGAPSGGDQRDPVLQWEAPRPALPHQVRVFGLQHGYEPADLTRTRPVSRAGQEAPQRCSHRAGNGEAAVPVRRNRTIGTSRLTPRRTDRPWITHQGRGRGVSRIGINNGRPTPPAARSPDSSSRWAR